jgi:cell wall-associated NlpC family hydrolase
MNKDFLYVGLPFKRGGAEPDGVDCRGLVVLWLRHEMGIEVPESRGVEAPESVLAPFVAATIHPRRGDVVFYQHVRTNQISHVGVHLGDGRILHSIVGSGSRIENGPTLIARLGYRPYCIVPAEKICEVAQALNSVNIGAAGFASLVLVIVASLASYALTPKPKAPKAGNRYGRYSDQSMVTQVSPEVPLPDLLGQLLTSGNAVYSQIQDRDSAVGSSSRWNRVVVLGSGPIDAVDTDAGLFVNGVSVRSRAWKDTTNNTGFALNPTQDYNNAVLGSINSDTNVPNLTVYPGAHGISVPVDIRASYDRGFPVHGLAGCAYLVFRLIDSSKFSSFNISARVQSRRCRTFNEDGFLTASATETESTLTGANGVKTRFLLAQSDIASVTAVSVNSTGHSELSASNQGSTTYHINRTKGFIEFITPPPTSATLSVQYTYYVREWTRNPASHLVYLLTEPTRGKGYPASKIDWAAAVSMRDTCDEQVSWISGDLAYYGPRYQCDYALDYRKPAQEHIRAILDACYGYLFLSNGRFVMRCRSAGSSVFSFNSTNIIRDSFSSEMVDRADRTNRLRILYHGEESLNAETEAVVDHNLDQAARAPRVGNGGVVEENLKFPAVTDRLQAERLGTILLQEDVHRIWTVRFATNIQGLALEPGDLIDVTHSSQPNWLAKVFRVEELSASEDDRMEITASEYFPGAYL